MNCEWTKENIALYIYDELADDARHQLENHARQCSACHEEIEAALEFKESMAALPVEEISPNMLAANRMKLQEALEHAHQSRGFGRFFFDLGGWMQQLKLAPAVTVALLMIGFAGGALTTYRLARTTPIDSKPADQPNVSEADIVGVKSVTPPDESGRVVIKYDTIQQRESSGASDNPLIHQLLMAGTRSNNPDVQMGSIEILKRKLQDDSVREALIASLRLDDNPGVRLKSLGSLKGWVQHDIHVRDAVVEALIHDNNAGVRGDAIRMLEPVRGDTSVSEALHSLAQHDKDAYIRSEARRILANSPTLY